MCLFQVKHVYANLFDSLEFPSKKTHRTVYCNQNEEQIKQHDETEPKQGMNTLFLIKIA